MVCTGVAVVLPDSLSWVAADLERQAADAADRVDDAVEAVAIRWDRVVGSAGATPQPLDVSADSVRRFHVDRAQVPARVVDLQAFDTEEIEAEYRGNSVTVSVQAFSTLQPNDPAASGLFARLVEPGGRAFASGSMRLVDSRFVGTIPLYGRDLNDFDVDVYYGGSLQPPRAGLAADDDKRALATAQDAFTAERLTLVSWVLGRGHDRVREMLEGVREQVGRVSLSGQAEAMRLRRESALANRLDWMDQGEPPWEAVGDVIRPTLAELTVYLGVGAAKE